MVRGNQHAWSGLAAEWSLHPIPASRRGVGPRWRTDEPALTCRVAYCDPTWRRRRRPAHLRGTHGQHCAGIGGDDGASLEAARSAKWEKMRRRRPIWRECGHEHGR